MSRSPVTRVVWSVRQWSLIVAEIERTIDADAAAQFSYVELSDEALHRSIDHTLLKLDTTPEQFDALCAEAIKYKFASVCARPEHVSQCRDLLTNSTVKIASVINFHEGTYPLSQIEKEIALSLSSGATELDIVLNHPLLLSSTSDVSSSTHSFHSYPSLYTQLSTYRTLSGPSATLKLIFETAAIHAAYPDSPSTARTAIIGACTLASAAGFDFVKTSTGFAGAGARIEDVRVMKAACRVLAGRKWNVEGGEGEGEVVAREMKVKASGGIRSLADARKMLEAGAERLGTSAGVAIAVEAAEGGRPTEGGGSGGKDEY